MNKTKITVLALYGVLASLFISCQTDDNTSQTGGKNSGNTYDIHTSATAAEGNTTATRALEVDADNGKLLHSKWNLQDRMLAYVLSDNDQSSQRNYSILTSKSAGKKSMFEGKITAMRTITTDNEICFLYPGAAAEGEKRTITPVSKNANNRYEAANTIKSFVSLNLTKQDGKAETIGNSFDYQWAKAKPTKVNGQDIDLYAGNMKRIISIWGLRFTDDKNKIMENIDSIYISNVKSSALFSLSTGSIVSDAAYTETENIVVAPANENDKLSSANKKYTYVAMLPGRYTDVHIMVYANGTCYEKDFSSLNLEADYVYHTDVLKMKLVGHQPPYVEVQGIKWATGNFIHYGDVNGGYWGIAPAQWWISGDRANTTQFATNPKQVATDVDLFHFGHIKEALDLKNSNVFTQDITNKQLYKRVGLFDRPADAGDEVYRGDIVWYYTRNNRQRYRMPSYSEIETLFNTANVIPAFCYTDKGAKVYGAYFTTRKDGEARTLKFPESKLENYSNVTAQVKANKGLFLPITGIRQQSQDQIVRRDVRTPTSFGQYMCSKLTKGAGKNDRNYDLSFGQGSWDFLAHSTLIAKAIRPVWDSGDIHKWEYVYDGFKDIH